MTVLPTIWRRKPAGIDMERNYVTVTLCILAFLIPKTPRISWSDAGLAPVESGPGFLRHRCVFGTNVGSECGHYRTRVCRRPWTSGIMPRPWTVTFRRATTSNTMKSPQILWSISRRSPWQNPPPIFSTVCSQKWRRIQERSLTRFLLRSWAPTKWGRWAPKCGP